MRNINARTGSAGRLPGSIVVNGYEKGKRRDAAINRISKFKNYGDKRRWPIF